MPLLRIFICLCLFCGGEAFACGFLKKSEPAVGAELTQSPPAITIWLSVPLDAAKSWIQVRDASGKHINTTSSASEDPTAIRTKLPPLPSGIYKVKWHMVAQSCNHISEGNFPFTVK